MIILAFDTCFNACSAGLRQLVGQRVVDVARFELMEKGHSERIVPMIGEVLGEAGFTVQDVDAYAVTTGPGSFTGVRTGIAVARALALATGKPVRGTSSLHVMAAGLRQLGHGGPIAIAISTRDGLVYFQTFDGAATVPANEPRVLSPEAAVEIMGPVEHMIGGTGGDLVMAAAALIGVSHRQVAGRVDADAAVLARMAVDLAVLTPPQPLYLRDADAKPQSGVLIQRLEAGV